MMITAAACAQRPYARIHPQEMDVLNEQPLRVFGADWCRDCRRTSKQLNDLGVPYDYVDLAADAAAAEVARQISGRTNIPVVVYPDGTHHVEPSNADVATKLRELSII